METFYAFVVKVGFPVAVGAYLVHFLVSGLAVQMNSVQQQLNAHQASMISYQAAEQQFLYQMCVSANVTAGRSAALCPQPKGDMTPSEGK